MSDRADGSEAVRASYDAVADRYADEIGDELARKPLDRALLTAFAELVRSGPGRGTRPTVGDVGCGPGHVTSFLGGLGVTAVGVDISPRMIEVARARYPDVAFHVGTFADPGVPDGAWAGAIAFYSIIHLEAGDRPAAFAGLARAIAGGGWLLLAFHVSSDDVPEGSGLHRDEWWGHAVDLEFQFLAPGIVIAEIAAAGFDLVARLDRQADRDVEYPSLRCYLLARRRLAT